MKKLMLVAAFGTAALFTACGDDSSSAKAGSYSCDVKVEGQSVITDWDIEGVKTQDIYTIEGDSLKIQKGTPDSVTTRALMEGEDLAFLENFAKTGCEAAIKLYEEAKNESEGGNGGNDGCTVTSDETSVTMNQTAMGQSYKTVWKIEGDEVVMTQEPAIDGVEPTRTPAEGVTIDILKASAEKSCETFNNAEVTPN